MSQNNQDTGFGDKASQMGGRMVNRDGTFNIQRLGIPFFTRVSSYHSMLTMPRWRFILVIFNAYFVMNCFFTLLYWLAGPSGLEGVDSEHSFSRIKELFFFSTQTFTTVGYGRVNPVGELTNWIAAIESLIGFLSFAIAAGLLYGRFSRPRSFVRFSEKMLLTNYEGGKALMFRLVGFKDDHILTNVEIKVSARLFSPEGNYRFYNLELERSHVDSLVLNWTIVHPINEKSPFWGLSQEDIQALQPEVSALLIGFDEVYSSTVMARNSYALSDLIFGYRFAPMYFRGKSNTKLDLSLLDFVESE
ncbi:ion channel [Aquirufa echingensis]|uniref:Ion channel n=1 Tax=Aquirufa echingensis TaxID=3096516 RepID=A0ABW6CX91_9BACT